MKHRTRRRSKRQLWNSLRWPVYVINSFDDTKLPCCYKHLIDRYDLHLCRDTARLEEAFAPKNHTNYQPHRRVNIKTLPLTVFWDSKEWQHRLKVVLKFDLDVCHFKFRFANPAAHLNVGGLSLLARPLTQFGLYLFLINQDWLRSRPYVTAERQKT